MPAMDLQVLLQQQRCLQPNFWARWLISCSLPATSTQAMLRSQGEVLHSGSTFALGISQRQKEWGIHERSVLSLPSVQDIPRRLKCDLKFNSRGFPLCFNPHKQFHKTTYIERDIIPSDFSHHILLWSQAQLKSNLIIQNTRELRCALYIKVFFIDTIFTSVDLTEF